MSETAIKPRIEKIPLKEQLAQKAPVFLVPALAVIGLIAIGNPASWLTLTVAGLAMGMMIFVIIICYLYDAVKCDYLKSLLTCGLIH